MLADKFMQPFHTYTLFFSKSDTALLPFVICAFLRLNHHLSQAILTSSNATIRSAACAGIQKLAQYCKLVVQKKLYQFATGVHQISPHPIVYIF